MHQKSIASKILSVLWDTGKITISFFLNDKYGNKYGYTSIKRSSYYSSFYRLKNKGILKKEGEIYYLTSRGRKEAFLACLNNNMNNYTPPNVKWDRKWRIIFFDIPEKKRKYRDYLRTVIRSIGFLEFQKSTWIYPYKVPSFLKELLFEDNIRQYTRLITTSDIEYDKDLRRKFNIS